MICERCKTEFPRKIGRFCGACDPDTLVNVLADEFASFLNANAHNIVGGEAESNRAIGRIQTARATRGVSP